MQDSLFDASTPRWPPGPAPRHHGSTAPRQHAYVAVSNKAEGSAPPTVLALAEALRDLQRPSAGHLAD